MKDVNIDRLLTAFPALFRNQVAEWARREETLFLDFECGDGWFKIVWDLAAEIERVAERSGLSRESPAWPQAVQIKQKVGSLRFYLELGQRRQYEHLVRAAADASLLTCEACGQGGTGAPVERIVRPSLRQHSSSSKSWREELDPKENHRLTSMDDWITQFLDNLQSEAANPCEPGPGPADFLTLGTHEFQLMPGEVVEFHAPTRDEKAARLIGALLATSRKSELPILLFLAEAEERYWANQIVSAVGQIDRQRLRSAMLLDFEWPRLCETVDSLRELPIHIITMTEESMRGMKMEVDRFAREVGQIGAVIVDADGLENPARAAVHLRENLNKERPAPMLLFRTFEDKG